MVSIGSSVRESAKRLSRLESSEWASLSLKWRKMRIWKSCWRAALVWVGMGLYRGRSGCLSRSACTGSRDGVVISTSLSSPATRGRKGQLGVETIDFRFQRPEFPPPFSVQVMWQQERVSHSHEAAPISPQTHRSAILTKHSYGYTC